MSQASNAFDRAIAKYETKFYSGYVFLLELKNNLETRQLVRDWKCLPRVVYLSHCKYGAGDDIDQINRGVRVLQNTKNVGYLREICETGQYIVLYKERLESVEVSGFRSVLTAISAKYDAPVVTNLVAVTKRMVVCSCGEMFHEWINESHFATWKHMAMRDCFLSDPSKVGPVLTEEMLDEINKEALAEANSTYEQFQKECEDVDMSIESLYGCN